MADDISSELMDRRQQTAGDAAAVRLQQVFGAQAEPSATEEVPGAADAARFGAQMADEDSDVTFGKVLSDVGRGVVESPRAIYTGVHKAAQETVDLANELSEWVEEKLPMGGFHVSKEGIRYMSPEELKKSGGGQLLDGDLPLKAEDPKSVTGQVGQNVARFVAGFIGGGKLLKGWKAASTTGRVAKAAAQGAISDFTVFDPHEQRLSDLIQKVPALQNPVTEYLQTNPDDSAAEGRLKNAVEGVVPGVLVDGLVLGMRSLRNVRGMKQATKAVGEYKIKVERESLNILGNVDETKLIATRKIETAAKEAAGVTPDAVLKEAAEPETFINFARINTGEDVQKVIQKVADLGKPGVDKAKRGVRTWEQTKLSADQTNAWDTLVKRRVGEPLNAEQSVAARQLWASSAEKLSEVAKTAAANPSEANLFAFRKMMATHYAIQKEVIAARTETARALNAWAIPAGSKEMLGKQIDFMLESAGGADVSRKMAERIAVLAEIGDPRAMEQFVEKGLYVKTSDAVAQVWINALLSNPTTHVVNTMSNYSVVMQQMYERKAAHYVGRLLGTQNGVELGESLAMMHGAVDGFKDALQVGVKTKGKSFLGASTPADLLVTANKVEVDAGALSAEVWNMQGTTIGKALDVVDTTTRVPGRLLQAGDEWFKTIGYRMELHAQAVRLAAQDVAAGMVPKEGLKARIAEIIANPPEHIKIEAVDAALYNTFTQKPAEVLDNVAKAWQRLPVLGRLTMPFRRTPINILTYAAERSPFAPLVKTWRADVAAGGARADIALARVATGTMMMAATMDLAMNGLITGSAPTESGARDAFKRAGKQAYSIKVGNTWYSFGRADPIGMTLGMAADTADIALTMDGGDADYEDLFIHGALSLAKNVTSKTYMEGMAGVFQVLGDPDRYGEGRAARIAGSFVPAGVAAVARQVDPYLRTASDMGDSLKRRVPYWSKDLPLYRDLWGREVDYRSGYGRLYDALSPIYVRHENPEPIDAEIDRIGYYPEMPPREFQYNGIPLNLEQYPQAYSRYVQLAGNEAKHPGWNLGAKDYLNAVVAGKHPMSSVYRLYSDGPDGGKAAFVRKTLDEYRDLAKEQVIKEFPELQVEYEFARKQNPYGNKIDPKILGLR